MKSIALILVLTASLGLHAQKYFKVLDATSTGWSGGMPQNGSGTNYTVKAVLLTDQEIKFTDEWIGNEYVIPERISPYADGRALKKGDTIMIRATVHRYPPGSPLAASLPAHKDPPSPYKGAALIKFTVGNKSKCRTVEKFRTTASQSYP